ncbi:MAG: hypothetical protein ACI8SE_001226 [Bacteroidia bacterium]|jgi:hypothetical protein
MKLQIILLFTALLMFGCRADEVPIKTVSDIVFKAKCNTLFSVSTFIDRGREIIWQETTEFADSFEFNHNTTLEAGDKVLLFVMPLDGKVHVIKTEIYIDGELQANQNKVCHAGGGCSYETE